MHRGSGVLALFMFHEQSAIEYSFSADSRCFCSAGLLIFMGAIPWTLKRTRDSNLFFLPSQLSPFLSIKGNEGTPLSWVENSGFVLGC